MTITINTLDYIKTKEAEINGITFKVRQMSSAETIAYMELSTEMAQLQDIKEVNSKTVETVKTLLEKALDLFTKCFDKQEEAKEIFGVVPMDKWLDILNQIMKGEE